MKIGRHWKWFYCSYSGGSNYCWIYLNEVLVCPLNGWTSEFKRIKRLEASCVWCHRWHASWLNAASSPSAYSSYSRAVRCRGPSWQWWKPLLQYCWILKHCLWSIRCIFSPAPVTLLPCQLNHLWTRGVCPIYSVSSLLCPTQLWLKLVAAEVVNFGYSFEGGG